MNRRDFIIKGGTAVTGVLFATPRLGVYAAHHEPYKLPKLPYSYDALAPHIDKRTMEIHHMKHHQGYINKLNAAVENSQDLTKLSLEAMLRNTEKVPVEVRQSIINSGGGHANHSLFWSIMSPDGGEPTGKVAEAIQSTFGSIRAGREIFNKAATTRFGSGWAWLVVDEKKKLQIYSTRNQDSPLMQGHTPILGLDVWEHAYYLKYQNRRADYVNAWNRVVNWKKVNDYYLAAIKSITRD